MSSGRLTLGANKHRHQGASLPRPHGDFAVIEQQTGQIDAQGHMPAAVSLQGVALYQPSPALYPTGSLLYPVWLPSYIVPPPYAYPLHSYWKPQYQGREQWYATNPVSTKAAEASRRSGVIAAEDTLPVLDRRMVESTEPTAMSGTGVFLPCVPLSAPSTASERSMAESEGDSVDSSSDCSTIEEPVPIKHGTHVATCRVCCEIDTNL